MALAGVHVALRTGGGERWRWLDDLGRAPLACWTIALGALAVATTPVTGPRDLAEPTAGQFATKLVLYLVVAVLLIVPVAFGPQTRTKGVLDSVVGRWLGRVSYGLFLWHPFVLEGIYLVDGRPDFTGDPLGTFLLTVAGGLVLAAVSYYAIERPCQRWGGQWPGRRRNTSESQSRVAGGDRGELRQPGGVPTPGDRPPAGHREARHRQPPHGRPAQPVHAAPVRRVQVRFQRPTGQHRDHRQQRHADRRRAAEQQQRATADERGEEPTAPPPSHPHHRAPGYAATAAPPAARPRPAARRRRRAPATYPWSGAKRSVDLAGEAGRHQPALLPAVHHERGERPAGGGGLPPGVGVLPQRQHPLAGVAPQVQHPPGGRPLVDPQHRPGRPGCRAGRRAAGRVPPHRAGRLPPGPGQRGRRARRSPG